MADALVVLATLLVLATFVGPVSLVVTIFLAKRVGTHVKKISISPTHGYTVEFFDPEEPQNGNN